MNRPQHYYFQGDILSNAPFGGQGIASVQLSVTPRSWRALIIHNGYGDCWERQEFSHAARELWRASFWSPLISKGNLRVPGTSPPNTLPHSPEGQQVLGSLSELPRGYQSYAERPNALIPAHSLQAHRSLPGSWRPTVTLEVVTESPVRPGLRTQIP